LTTIKLNDIIFFDFNGAKMTILIDKSIC